MADGVPLHPKVSAKQLKGQAALLSGLLALTLPFLFPLGTSLRELSRQDTYLELKEGRWRATDDETSERFETPGRVRAGWDLIDGRPSWNGGEPEAVPGAIPLHDIAVLPDGDIVAVGDRGACFHRTRAGVWRLTRSGGPPLRTIAITRSGSGYAAGDRGVLVRLGDESVVLSSGAGPDLVDLRLDSDGRRFFASARRGTPSWLVRGLGLGVLAIAGALLWLVFATGSRVWRWQKARRGERIWTALCVAVEAEDTGALAYVLEGQVAQQSPEAEATIRLVSYRVSTDARLLRYSVAEKRPVVVGASGAFSLAGSLSPHAEAFGGEMDGDLELALEVTLKAGRAEQRYEALFKE